ncbi:uncharacterized protein LOC142341485 [Convolutriloba macropyga]|uniref:uncharacterized protein LOC142341485 n=1 Tax=Convolutriloba macropyga TaxID=536237 RepID=UPI003F51C361
MDLKNLIVVTSGNPVRKIPINSPLIVHTSAKSDGGGYQYRPTQFIKQEVPAPKHWEPVVQRTNAVPITTYHDYSEKGDSDDELAKPPRKKACLSHMSDTEKNMRRKLKNRESAQTARDKKKFYLESLEQQVKTLEEEKLTLQQAKSFVEQKCDKIEAENERLKEQLREARLGIKQAARSTVTVSDSSQHWESVCRDLMVQKEELTAKLRDLESKLVVKQECYQSPEQVDCLVPIDNEIEVATSEESFESAALSVSPQQNHFLHALMAMISMLLLSTKSQAASSGECTTLLEHALKKTYKEGKLDQKSQVLIIKKQMEALGSHKKISNAQKKPP